MKEFIFIFEFIFMLLCYFFTQCQTQISDFRLCADPLCSTPISLAKTQLNYNSNHKDILSFKPGKKVTIYSKGAGNLKSLWGGEINGKRGYFSQTFVKEYKILVKPTDLIYTVPTKETDETFIQPEPEKIIAEFQKQSITATPFFFAGASAELPGISNEKIDPNRVQYEVFEGTTLYADNFHAASHSDKNEIIDADTAKDDTVEAKPVKDKDPEADATNDNTVEETSVENEGQQADAGKENIVEDKSPVESSEQTSAESDDKKSDSSLEVAGDEVQSKEMGNEDVSKQYTKENAVDDSHRNLVDHSDTEPLDSKDKILDSSLTAGGEDAGNETGESDFSSGTKNSEANQQHTKEHSIEAKAVENAAESSDVKIQEPDGKTLHSLPEAGDILDFIQMGDMKQESDNVLEEQVAEEPALQPVESEEEPSKDLSSLEDGKKLPEQPNDVPQEGLVSSMIQSVKGMVLGTLDQAGSVRKDDAVGQLNEDEAVPSVMDEPVEPSEQKVDEGVVDPATTPDGNKLVDSSVQSDESIQGQSVEAHESELDIGSIVKSDESNATDSSVKTHETKAEELIEKSNITEVEESSIQPGENNLVNAPAPILPDKIIKDKETSEQNKMNNEFDELAVKNVGDSAIDSLTQSGESVETAGTANVSDDLDKSVGIEMDKINVVPRDIVKTGRQKRDMYGQNNFQRGNAFNQHYYDDGYMDMQESKNYYQGDNQNYGKDNQYSQNVYPQQNNMHHHNYMGNNKQQQKYMGNNMQQQDNRMNDAPQNNLNTQNQDNIGVNSWGQKLSSNMHDGSDGFADSQGRNHNEGGENNNQQTTDQPIYQSNTPNYLDNLKYQETTPYHSVDPSLTTPASKESENIDDRKESEEKSTEATPQTVSSAEPSIKTDDSKLIDEVYEDSVEDQSTEMPTADPTIFSEPDTTALPDTPEEVATTLYPGEPSSDTPETKQDSEEDTPETIQDSKEDTSETIQDSKEDTSEPIFTYTSTEDVEPTEGWFNFSFLTGLFSSSSAKSPEVNIEVGVPIPDEGKESIFSFWPSKKEMSPLIPDNTCTVGGISDSSCEKTDHGSPSDENLSMSDGYMPKDDDLLEELKDSLQKVSLDAVAFLIITAVAVLVFSLGYYYLDNHRYDGVLIARLNMLERDRLVREKENAILEEQLKVANERSVSSEEDLSDFQSRIDTLTQECEDLRAAKIDLEDQLVALERELENIAESNLEMNNLLSESLSTQDGSQVLLSTVETLRGKLEYQNTEMKELNRLLGEKSEELETIHKELKSNQESKRSLQEKLTNLKREKEEELLQLKETNRSLSTQLDDLMESKSLDELKLSNEISKLQMALTEAQTTLGDHEGEIDALKEAITKLQSPSKEEDLETLYDVAKVAGKLTQAEADRETYKEKFHEEEGARKLLEGHVQVISQEVASLKENYEAAEKDKIEALTKLQVLSNYFKEKESQLQKELGTQESMWLQKQSDDHTIYEQMKSLREENDKYKMQIESLKKEIVESESDYKTQVSNAEQKAHDNWLTSRQYERRLKESQNEATQLRNRLTLVEKNATNHSSDDLKQNISMGETNGDPSSPPPSLPMFPPATSPFMMFPSPMPPPPGDFIPLPPLVYPEARPPTLGRISSPSLDHRFSPPPPPLPPYVYDPAGYPGHHSPSPPPHRSLPKSHRDMGMDQKEPVPPGYSEPKDRPNRRSKR